IDAVFFTNKDLQSIRFCYNFDKYSVGIVSIINIGKQVYRVKIFSLRFSVFAIFWGLIILLDSINTPLSVMFFAVSLAIYFFLSIKTALLLLYIMLSFVICVHGYLLTDNTSLSLLLLLFMTMEAATVLPEKTFPYYLTVNIGLSV